MSGKLTHNEVDDYLKDLIKQMKKSQYLSKKKISFGSNDITIEQTGNPDYRIYKYKFLYKTKTEDVLTIALVDIVVSRTIAFGEPTSYAIKANCVLDPHFYNQPVTKTQIHAAKFMKSLLEENFSCTIDRFSDGSNIIHDKTRVLNKARFEEFERIAKGCTRKLNLITNEPLAEVNRYSLPQF